MMYGCRNFYFMLDSYPVVSKTRTPNKQTAPLGIGSRCATMHRLENYKACKETGVITEQTPRSEMPLAKPRTKTDRKNTNFRQTTSLIVQIDLSSTLPRPPTANTITRRSLLVQLAGTKHRTTCCPRCW